MQQTSIGYKIPSYKIKNPPMACTKVNRGAPRFMHELILISALNRRPMPGVIFYSVDSGHRRYRIGQVKLVLTKTV
jgi:hypothetical protein